MKDALVPRFLNASAPLLEMRGVAAITALTLTLSRAGSGTGEGSLFSIVLGERSS
jgi:hypothetical protein